MSEENVTVHVARGFLNGSDFVDVGDSIKVTEQRARDLEQNGLVTRGEKQAPAPSNKAAPTPKNKAKEKTQ